MSENILGEDVQHLDSYGKGGLLPLTKYKATDAVREVLLEAAKEIGYAINDEDGKLGFVEGVQNIHMGTRANAAKAFLGAVKDSNKLTLSINTHINKILIEKIQKEAKGVELMIGGKILNVFADKEVILSAGTLNSPQILMLSGIGPKEHLQKLGIDVVQDLKVGENLQDHMMFFIASKLNDKAANPSVLEDELYEYFSHRKGAFSNIGVSNIQGFVNTRNDSKYPDIQYTHVVMKKNDTNSLDALLEVFNMNPNVHQNVRKSLSENNILLTLMMMLQPKSRGKVLLRANDPQVSPIFHTGYLRDETGQDMATMLGGVRIAQALLRTKSFKKLDAEILNYEVPNCGSFEYDSDDYWRCAIRNIATTFYHLTSTCKMGKENDKDAVVDPNLRVYGIKNLRVIDASVMPQVTSGNTNAPSMMIGQKGAQMIIDDNDVINKNI